MLGKLENETRLMHTKQASAAVYATLATIGAQRMPQSFLIRRALSAVVWLIKGGEGCKRGGGKGMLETCFAVLVGKTICYPICTILRLIYSFNVFSTCGQLQKFQPGQNQYTNKQAADRETVREGDRDREAGGKGEGERQAQANSFVCFRAQNQQPLHTLRRKTKPRHQGASPLSTYVTPYSCPATIAAVSSSSQLPPSLRPLAYGCASQMAPHVNESQNRNQKTAYTYTYIYRTRSCSCSCSRSHSLANSSTLELFGLLVGLVSSSRSSSSTRQAGCEAGSQFGWPVKLRAIRFNESIHMPRPVQASQASAAVSGQARQLVREQTDCINFLSGFCSPTGITPLGRR